MIFNSIEFAIFLPVVFLVYWSVGQRSYKLQNLVVLFSSYFFYGWWDWRFLSLIILSTTVDFYVGIGISGTNNIKIRKILLFVSLFVNLSLLGFFKYYNFFIDSFSHAFMLFGVEIPTTSINIILPVGISFYTFQTLSYSIDVYLKRINHTSNALAFFSFVSFFPQLVAGPIERATNLLPQFLQKRKFDYGRAVDGLRQILWGLFKKIVIADGCSKYVNNIFENYTTYSSSTLLLGAFLFTFQIYGDFSGYSDVAIGISRLFGINLMRNFSYPYFSRNIVEFWQRWHISLTSWFKDYLYIPLGGNRNGTLIRIRNIFIVFLVSGLWHGPKWTFIFWGMIHACLYIVVDYIGNSTKKQVTIDKMSVLRVSVDALKMFFTFLIIVITWVFFRSENISMAVTYIVRMVSLNIFSKPEILPLKEVFVTVLLVCFMMLVEWLQRNEQHALGSLHTKLPVSVRWFVYYILMFVIIKFGAAKQDFIYFQF